jgi:hypothetical protein
VPGWHFGSAPSECGMAAVSGMWRSGSAGWAAMLLGAEGGR